MLFLRAELEGLGEVGKRLARLERGAREDILEIAARQSGHLLVMAMLDRVPVETGRDYRSIRFQVQRSGDAAAVEAGPQPGFAEIERGRLQDPQHYDPIIEAIGSPIGRGLRYKQKALAAASPEIRRTIVAILQAALEGRRSLDAAAGRLAPSDLEDWAGDVLLG